MARPLWKGYISFGLVNVPVELRSAVRDPRPRFRLLHRKDLSPIAMQRVCQREGKPVAWEDVVKGYEVESGTFVALAAEDFKAAALERSRSIQIVDFVPVADIDPRYWDTPYLTRPGRGGESTYTLLAEALERSGRAGVAKYVMRERQHLAAIRGRNGQVLLSTLRFQTDFIAGEPIIPVTQAGDRELRLAIRLIDGLSNDWDPQRYTDDYISALMKVIDAKARGAHQSTPTVRTQRPTNVIDLAERLRQSLRAVESRRAGTTPVKGKGRRTAVQDAQRAAATRTSRAAKRKRSVA